MEVVGGLGLHPGGEALVEPEVVPPGHGDEIAEPLVCELVGDQAENAAPRGAGARRRIEQQAALAERDRAPVLHRADVALRNRDQVELRQRIFQAEIVVEVAQEADRAVEREASLRALAGGGDHADRDAFGLAGEPLELARREREQVGRHFRRGRERHLLQRRRDRLLAGDRHVADHRERARHRHGERERRLEGRLVPAREDAARRRRGEMAREHPPAALLGLVVDDVEPGPRFVDLAREGNAQLVRADGERLRKGERRGLRVVVERDGGALRPIVDRGGGERQVLGIEHELRGRLAHLDVDGHGARQREALEIRARARSRSGSAPRSSAACRASTRTNRPARHRRRRPQAARRRASRLRGERPGQTGS